MSKYAVQLTLGSSQVSGGETVDITAHVVDQITSDYKPQDLSGTKSMPFIKGKNLADPDFGSSGRIDLLLSMWTQTGTCLMYLSPLPTEQPVHGRPSSVGWSEGKLKGRQTNMSA